MLGGNVYLVLLGLAAVFGVMSARDYVANDRKLTPAGKVQLRMAIILLVIGAYQLITRL